VKKNCISWTCELITKKSVGIRFGSRHGVCCAQFGCSTLGWHMQIRVSILSVIGPLNVRLSRPESNFIKHLMLFSGKTGRVAPAECYNEVSLFQMSPSAFICHRNLSLLIALSELNIFYHDSCFNENFQQHTRSRDITEQYQLMFDMLPVVCKVLMRKSRFWLRFRHSENLIYSLFVSNASNEIAFICNKYVCMHVLDVLPLDMNRFSYLV